MKVKVGSRLLVKQIISMVSSKAEAVKTRLMVTAFTLLSKRKKLSLAAIFEGGTVNTNAIVVYESKAGSCSLQMEEDSSYSVQQFNDDDDKYPDLRHSLFDEEEEKELAQLLDDPSSSISAIDLVKNGNDKFNLEDEINEVADLFITKFHKRMRLQKLLSFKRQAQDDAQA